MGAAVVLALGPEAGAVEYVSVGSAHVAEVTDGAAARAYLKRNAGALKLEGVELEVGAEIRVGSSLTVRLRQRHRGLPVVGATAAVHAGPGAEVSLVMLDVARGLGVDVEPRWTAKQAEARVGSQRAGSDGAGWGETLAVLPQGSGPGKLIWLVEAGGVAERWEYVVDAQDGSVLSFRRITMDVLGRVYPKDSVTTPWVEDRELAELDLANPQILTGWGGQLAVTNFLAYGVQPGQVFLEQKVTPNAGEDFLYDPPADSSDLHDAFSQVNAYYHLTRGRDFFRTKFGLDVTGSAWKVVFAANVRQDGKLFDGAFFTPSGVGSPWNAPNFLGTGQGAAVDFATDSDALLHEFTHYISYNAVCFDAGQFATDDLGWSPFSIAIDEGIADYFACTMNGDPVVGEATLGPLGKSRDLSDGSRKCPDDVVGEGHLDGMLVGSFAWSLHEAFGAGVADELVWGAVSMLPFGASFGDFVRGIRQVAAELTQAARMTSADAETLEALLRARGLDDCGREIAVVPGKARRTLMFGLQDLGKANGVSCEEVKKIDLALPSIFQFVAKGSPAAHGVRFRVRLEPVEPGALDWSLYVRRNEHVAFGPGSTLPVVTQYDYVQPGLTAAVGELVVDETSDPPYDSAATYHLILTHRNCPGVAATVEVEDVTEPGGEAGVADGGGVELSGAQEGNDAGCGCHVDAREGTGCWGSAGGLAIAWVARRRRRAVVGESPKDASMRYRPRATSRRGAVERE